MGEALGGGGRGAHRWRGGARWSRKKRSSAGEAWDGGCSGVRSGGWHGSIGPDGGGGGVRAGGPRGVGRAGETNIATDGEKEMEGERSNNHGL
jgi:hypothetical protein